MAIYNGIHCKKDLCISLTKGAYHPFENHENLSQSQNTYSELLRIRTNVSQSVKKIDSIDGLFVPIMLTHNKKNVSVFIYNGQRFMYGSEDIVSQNFNSNPGFKRNTLIVDNYLDNNIYYVEPPAKMSIYREDVLDEILFKLYNNLPDWLNSISLSEIKIDDAKFTYMLNWPQTHVTKVKENGSLTCKKLKSKTNKKVKIIEIPPII